MKVLAVVTLDENTAYLTENAFCTFHTLLSLLFLFSEGLINTLSHLAFLKDLP